VDQVRPGKLTTSPQRSPRGARRRGPRPAWEAHREPPAPHHEAPVDVAPRPACEARHESQRSPRGARPTLPHVRSGRSPQSRARWRAASVPFARSLVRGIGAFHAAHWRGIGAFRAARWCAASAPFARPAGARHRRPFARPSGARHWRLSRARWCVTSAPFTQARGAASVPCRLPIGARRPCPVARPLARGIRALSPALWRTASTARIHPPTGARRRRELPRPLADLEGCPPRTPWAGLTPALARPPHGATPGVAPGVAPGSTSGIYRRFTGAAPGASRRHHGATPWRRWHRTRATSTRGQWARLGGLVASVQAVRVAHVDARLVVRAGASCAWRASRQAIDGICLRAPLHGP
jgi:hypothetical protein